MARRSRRQNLSPITILLLVIVAIIYGVMQLTSGQSGKSGTGGTTVPRPGVTNPPQQQNAPNNNAPAAPGNYSWGKQTKTSGCAAHNALADSACTPGDFLPNATKDKICVSGYASSVRNVPDSEKNQVYAEYGIKSHTPGQYEVDHLVSLELGGSNDVSNLWPELAEPKPGFHEKDKVENYLHDQVCAGNISLKDAQYKIATNWLEIYNSMPKK
jgi:hypothetical protein